MKRAALVFLLIVVSCIVIHREGDALRAAPARGTAGEAVDRTRLLDMAASLRLERRANRERALRLARERGWPIAETLPGGGAYALQGIFGGMPQYYATCNEDAAVSTRTDLVNGAIGGGAGFTIGIWDGGKVRTTHQELTGRATWYDGSVDLSDHSTHVAGTLIASGVRAAATGMAWAADLDAHEWTDDEGEMATAAAAGLTISNHSYSFLRGWYENTGFFNPGWYWYGDSTVSETEDYHFGFYDDLSVSFDDLANAAPDYLVVVAAANDRNDNVPAPGTEHYYYHYGEGKWKLSTKVRDADGGILGWDCLPNGKQTAKNALVVGAVEDVAAYTGPGDVVMTDFSSWGPTDDGRIKPDLVGNGWELYSCVSDADTSYFGGASGTSMASPNVCGSLALVQDYWMDQHAGVPMLATTLKALAINTTREAGPADGPDYMFGWGLLDAFAAYELAAAEVSAGSGLIDELTLADGSALEYAYFCDGTAPELRVTICWSDPAGTPPAPAVDPGDIMLVNDLDLRVTGGDAQHEPWRLDPAAPGAAASRGDNFRDNVEQVLVDTPAAGIYFVRIDHKGALEGGSQDLSLVVSGAVRVGVWHVYEDGSGDAADIASAVAAASDGDLVYVHPGVYDEHDIIVDKQLVIESTDGPDATVVDAGSLGRCFRLDGSCGASVLDGFTMRNGLTSGSARGAGISCQSGDATIRDCVVESCTADYAGGMHFSYASATVEDCVIRNCTANDYGGGVYLYFASPTFTRCLFTGNSAATNGGGLSLYESAPLLDRCTVSHNAAAGHGGGIYIGWASHPALDGAIVSFSTDGEGIYGPASASPALTIACSDVYGNAGGDYGGSIGDKTGIDGNIKADPLFCNADTGDYGLQGMSPCLPGNNSCGVYMGARGMACHTRSQWYVAPGGGGDAPTIQAAVDSAVAGDTVLVGAGTWTGPGNRDIRLYGKPILVVSESGRDVTFIDAGSGAGDDHAGFYCSDGEDTTTVIRGFTMTACSDGGLRLHESSPLVEDCRMYANHETGTAPGCGVVAYNSSAVLRGCEVTANTTGYDGGGALVHGATADLLLDDCEIMGNTAGHYGGGVAVKNGASVTLDGCLVRVNEADEFGAGIYVESGSRAAITGCAIELNTGYSGGGIDTRGVCSVTETIIRDNDADVNGGGIFAGDSLTVDGCTIVRNAATSYGSGVYCAGSVAGISRSIVAFNTTDGTAVGVWSSDDTVHASCCDVFGNDNANYGGGVGDQTGLLGNVSEDPLFCDTLASDFAIYDDSPCAPDHSPCGLLIGALGVDCYGAPDLVVDLFEYADVTVPAGGIAVAEIKIKNVGASTADTFQVDWYANRSSAPPAGTHGTRRLRADSLAAGDSLVWTIDDISYATIAEWSSWVRVDTDNDVTEKDEGNNLGGPRGISWYAPAEPGWPVAGGGDFRSSPVLANIDDDPVTLETVVGCDDGYLYAWRADGSPVPGAWPVSLGAPIASSPAAGNIRGDYHLEIVVGTGDGSLYALDHEGAVLWSYPIGGTLDVTPALADIDDDGFMEIFIGGLEDGKAATLYGIDGAGGDLTGSWPVKLGGGTIVTSAAVGDVDDDGSFEIAVVTSGYDSPDYAHLHLFSEIGAAYGPSWPVTIDTTVVAPPVMGDIAGAGDDLEIVAGALSGEVFAVAIDGSAVWPSPPRVPGMIERSPAVVGVPKAPYPRIAVSSRYWQYTMPPLGIWYTHVTLIDDAGTIASGWPNSAGYWSADYGPVPGPIGIGECLLAATQERDLFAWAQSDGDDMPAFPRHLDRRSLSTPAAGDIDGDGVLEIVIACSPDSVRCLELCSPDYPVDGTCWPMFRNDRTRCGCYVVESVTGIGNEPEDNVPAVTRLAAIYPNPFNPSTNVRFDVHRRSAVRIALYDVNGRLVRLLVDRVMAPGSHTAAWDGRTAGGRRSASGVYFCRMRAGDVVQTRKMVLLR